MFAPKYSHFHVWRDSTVIYWFANTFRLFKRIETITHSLIPSPFSVLRFFFFVSVMNIHKLFPLGICRICAVINTTGTLLKMTFSLDNYVSLLMQSQNVCSNRWEPLLFWNFTAIMDGRFFLFLSLSVLSSSHISTARITFRKVSHFVRKKLIEMKFYLQQHVRFIIRKNPKWLNLFGSNCWRGTQNGGPTKEFLHKKVQSKWANERESRKWHPHTQMKISDHIVMNAKYCVRSNVLST